MSGAPSHESFGGERTTDRGRGDRPTALVLSDHELLRCIGGGSYGEVWLARCALGHYRAIKIVYRDRFENDRPFEREFNGIRRFEPISRSHPSQVNILHAGRGDGYFYYVMELADDARQETGSPTTCKREAGASAANVRPSLLLRAALSPADYLPRTLKLELSRRGHLAFDECLEIGLALTTALVHLHRHGLVHRDIKPSNIIFVNGVPKLADIGLVTSTDTSFSCVGTEGYLPPEGSGTLKADLYSLGKVLYEMSTGKDRNEFPEPATNLGQSPDRNALLELDEIIYKACATDPARRYASAEAMYDDLLLLKSGRSIRRLHKVERRLASLSRLSVIGTAALVVASAAYLWAAQQLGRAERAEAKAQETLRDAYLAEARANRWSQHPGRRFEALDVLARAAAMRPGLDLRNELIACLALTDMRPGKPLARGPDNRTVSTIHPRYASYARSDDYGNITVRRFSDDSLLTTLPGFGFRGVLLWFSPSGDCLAAKYDDPSHPGQNVVQVWEIDQGRTLLSLTNALLDNALDFHPLLPRVAIGSKDRTLSFYDLGSTNPTNRIPATVTPYALRFSPDGDRLAVCSSREPWVVILDPASGAVRNRFRHPAGSRDLAWAPGGKTLAVACADKRVHLWDLSRETERAVLAAHKGDVVRLAFSSDGALLASGGWDAAVCLWDAWTGDLLQRITGKSLHLQFSSDNEWVGLTVSGAGLLSKIELAFSPECRALVSAAPSPIRTATFSPDGRLLVVATDTGLILWDPAQRLQAAAIPMTGVRDALFTPDGATLILIGRDEKVVERWPLTVGDATSVRLGPPHRIAAPEGMESFCLLPCLSKVAVSCAGHSKVIDLNSTSKTVELPSYYRQPPYLAVSPNGRWIAMGPRQEESDVVIWDVVSGRLAHTIRSKGSVHVLFSPDGRWLVTGSGFEYQFWQTGSWTPYHRIPGEAGPVAGRMTFSPDGRLLAIRKSSQTIQLIDPSDGRELATLSGELPFPLCFSSDGTLLAVCDDVTGVRLWDLQLVRKRLAAMNLDWSAPPYPRRTDRGPLQLQVVREEGAPVSKHPLQARAPSVEP